MRGLYSADQVRAAEQPLLDSGGDALMRRAAFGLEVACSRLIAADRGLVTGATVVLLVGSGSNGGDALWAGAGLARRGARVLAVRVAEAMHEGGRTALLSAGGRIVPLAEAARAIEQADLVVDGIVGIGGRGPLRGEAAFLARTALLHGVRTVACDLPSGIDATTGEVADPEAVVRADVTVTFGAIKTGTVVMPAAEYVGVLDLIDIGLSAQLPADAAAWMVDADDVALRLPAAVPDSHKYSRGVVCVHAGSDQYAGAAVLVVGGARHGGAGLVRYDGPAREAVLARYPDVVVGDGRDDPRTTTHVIGPGLADGAAPPAALDSDAVVLLDATALRGLGAGGAWAASVRRRADRGLTTVVTPHDGEFAALGGPTDLLASDRVGAARALAHALGAVVLLKGPTTVIAAPAGRTWVTPLAPSTLATAGSGDVLAGLAGSWLAAHAADARAAGSALSPESAAEVIAAAAWLHALCGRVAGAGGAPVAALDLVDALPEAIRLTRGAS